MLEQDAHVLFFGDSITDAGRRLETNNPQQMGTGYPAMIAARVASRHPELRLRFTNRGISGDRVVDLLRRLDEDVLADSPDVVSILIGINDTWRRYDRNDPTSTASFAAGYRKLLERLAGGGVGRLVMCEPFVLPIPDDRAGWREDLDPKIGVVRRLAREFEAVLVPLDGLFAAASCRAPLGFWLPDGVHPSPAGHALIADAWISAVLGGRG
jgi:lysophospholipase L1-like esterase